MLSIKTFSRREYSVDGVQVTTENINDVARWCGGQVMAETAKDGVTQVLYIKVDVHRPLNEKQTRAYVSDYVLVSPTGYKVYTERALEKNFEEQGGDTFVDLGDVVSYDEPGNILERARAIEEEAEKDSEKLAQTRPVPAPPTTGKKLGFDPVKEPFGSRKQV